MAIAGIRITKDFWPKPGVLSWPDGFGRLDRSLEPIAMRLDRCWWYIGGQGISIPFDLPKDRKPTEEEWARATAAQEVETEEVSRYLTAGGRSGRPGFFSRGSRGLSGDWKFYVVADAAEEPVELFEQLARDHRDLIARPAEPPPEVCLVVQGVDWAYWDIFFRDCWMFEKVWEHMRDRKHLIVESR
jgi:hypothetical protein